MMYYKRRIIPAKNRQKSQGMRHNEASDGLRAAALGYEPNIDEAPRLLASGQGKIAKQIIAIARENQIPIHEDPVLVAALAGIDLNSTIPVELYEIVAEVLAFVYRVSGRTID